MSDISAELGQQLGQIKQTYASITGVRDLVSLQNQVDELEKLAAANNLWDDPENAQDVTSRLSYAQAELTKLNKLAQRIDDLDVLLEMAEESVDLAEKSELHQEAVQELKDLQEVLAQLEIQTLLAGEYDEREALVTIRSESGGVDAADWALMLFRMYLRWAERRKYSVKILDTSYAEEAGIKSATFAVNAPFAYGTLSVEQGTHRLVRISPFDNQGRRHTSFAGVEVLPVVAETDQIDIADADYKMDVFHSSGPGGQSVNTTNSAVRITHLPTGIVVTCQNEKSQLQNKASALRVLQSRLLELAKRERQAELDALKTDDSGSWGNQMRSYVLNPYQMVKDLRTGHETTNSAAVLDGDIDGFLEAGIRWRRLSQKSD